MSIQTLIEKLNALVLVKDELECRDKPTQITLSPLSADQDSESDVKNKVETFLNQ